MPFQFRLCSTDDSTSSHERTPDGPDTMQPGNYCDWLRRFQSSLEQIVPLAIAVALLACAGCGGEMAQPTALDAQTDREQPSLNIAPPASDFPLEEPVPAAERRAKLVGEEKWDVYYIGSARIGYGSTQWQADDNADAGLITAQGRLRLSLKRFGEENVSEVKLSVVENADGAVRSVLAETKMGPAPTVVRGQVDGTVMQLKTESNGQVRPGSMPWPARTGGYFAMEESLLCRPMQPDEKRRIRCLMPIHNQITEMELRAIKREKTELLDSEQELLRIETTSRLPGSQPIEGLIWTNADGEVLKTLMSAMDQVVYRTTKEVALGDTPANSFDLGDRSLVRLASGDPSAHTAQELTYRVHLDDADPQTVFVNSPAQQVTPIDARTADIVVRAQRPGKPPGKTPAAETSPPTDEERKPNAYVQSDDPRVMAMAQAGAGNEKDAWRTAVALERYVHDKVAAKNYSQTFASAAEVAASLEGDCTEHAVLLAALLRARGLPARVAIGLVYLPTAEAFGFHMWTEVYIDGEWIGLDGTLGLGGTGAGHLKIATSNLTDATAFSSFLPVAQVMGKLKIELVKPPK